MLFIFDFDETIVSANTHNLLCRVKDTRLESLWDVVKVIPPTRDIIQWRDILRSILNQKEKLAIASFNSFGSYIIPKYLEEIIGLTMEEVSAIVIESWLPFRPEVANKNDHIDLISKTFDYQASKSTIVLIDDNLDNVIGAKMEGYQAIHAEGDFLSQVQRLLDNDHSFEAHSSHFFKAAPLASAEPKKSQKSCILF